MNWPVSGGEYWLRAAAAGPRERRAVVGLHASKLAYSMYVKMNLLRRSASALGGGLADLFRWQGGKGTIWTPPGVPLTPYRLHCHGCLIEHLGGKYFGSLDVGVGKPQLELISEATRHTIGLRVPRDTGESVACGLLAGLKRAVREMKDSFGTSLERPLDGGAPFWSSERGRLASH